MAVSCQPAKSRWPDGFSGWRCRQGQAVRGHRRVGEVRLLYAVVRGAVRGTRAVNGDCSADSDQQNSKLGMDSRTLCGSSFATTSNSACNGGMVNQRSNQLPRPPVSVPFGDMVVGATIPSVPGLPTFTFHGILDYRPLNFEETTYGNTMYQPLGTRGLAMARNFNNMIEQLGIVVSCGLQRTRTSCQPTPAPRTRTRIFFHWETKLKISLWPWSRFYWLVPTTIPNSSQLHH